MKKIKKALGIVALAVLLTITGIILFDRLVPPHGERLVFSKLVYANLVSAKDDTICVMNAAGWHRRCRIEGTNPAWSPDGKRIAFVSPQPTDKGYDLDAVFVANGDGTDLIQLTDVGYNEDPTWSPDGSHVTFSSNREGGIELYTIDIRDNTLIRLTYSNNGTNGEPVWSPDGQQIAFAASASSDEDIDIYVMNADGSNIRRLTDDPAHDRHPDWSPDGQKIAFDSNRDGNWEIYVMDADGSNQIRLTDHPETDRGPVWSPDGKRIAFLSGRSGRTWYYWIENMTFSVYDIFVMNADGTQVRRLTYGFGEHNYEDLDWSSQ